MGVRKFDVDKACGRCVDLVRIYACTLPLLCGAEKRYIRAAVVFANIRLPGTGRPGPNPYRRAYANNDPRPPHDTSTVLYDRLR